MAYIIYGMIILALAIMNFWYLAWTLLSIWQARGWMRKENLATGHGHTALGENNLKALGIKDCEAYCRESMHPNDTTAAFECEELCRAY